MGLLQQLNRRPRDHYTRRPATPVSNIADPTALSYPVVYKSAFGSPGDLLLNDLNLGGSNAGFPSDIFIHSDGTYFNSDGEPLSEAGLLRWRGSGTFFHLIGYPVKVPNLTLSVRVESKTTVSSNQFIEMGFGKDGSNYIGAYYDLVNGGVNFELKDAGAGTTMNKGDGSGASIAGTITFPATLRVTLSYRTLAFYWNDRLLGVAEVPSGKLATFDPLKNSVLSTWRPFVKVINNNAGDIVAVSSIQLHAGCRMNYREPNLVTYEDGTPVRDTDGGMFLTVTHQAPTSQLNQRSLASAHWGVYKYDPDSLRLTPVGTIHESRGGSTYGLCIGKILFDRRAGKWKIWALDSSSRPFLSSDGTNNKWWNHYYETALCPLFGVTLLDYDNTATDLTIATLAQALITGTSGAAGNQVYDIDVAWVNGQWYMTFASSGSIYRTTSTDGKAWTAPVLMNNVAGEGSRIRKFGNTYYCLAGTNVSASPFGLSVVTLTGNVNKGVIALSFITANVVMHPNVLAVPTANGKTVYRIDSFDTVSQSYPWSYGGRWVGECTTLGNGLEFDDVRGVPNR